MSLPTVKCEVNTCTHWLNNLCTAANIDILNQEVGKMSQNDEETQCKTFEKRRGLANMMGSADNVNWMGMVKEPFSKGQQATPTVTCVVNTCKYWEDGNKCEAKAIKVTGKNASECQETNCATFEK